MKGNGQVGKVTLEVIMLMVKWRALEYHMIEMEKYLSKAIGKTIGS